MRPQTLSRVFTFLSTAIPCCAAMSFLTAAGCAAHHTMFPSAQSPQPAAQSIISGDTSPPPANSDTDAAPPQTSNGTMTPVTYRLQMPYGANSRDDSFWKLVNEDIVDIPTSQRLAHNGLRVGRANIADWPNFFTVLTNEGAIKLSTSHTTSLFGFGDARFNMTDVIPEETLYIYDEHGLTMRSFDDCINQLSIAFAWAPRKLKTIRVTLCPVIQSIRSRMDYSLSDNPLPMKIQQAEKVYNLNLCADVAPGEFLVVGTSGATQDPNRVGSLFLTRDGPNQRFEEVLIIVGETVPMPLKKSHTANPTTR